MSPEKATVIFRDGWEPFGSRKCSKQEKLKAEQNMELAFKKLGIGLNIQKLTLIDLYSDF